MLHGEADSKTLMVHLLRELEYVKQKAAAQHEQLLARIDMLEATNE